MIKKNTIANFIGQGFLLISGLIVAPVYLNLLGSEAYGLIGFFAVLQTWLHLLDMGISPTLSRVVAAHKHDKSNLPELWKILKSFESLLIIFAAIIVVIIWSIRSWISSEWLNTEIIEPEILKYSISIMGVLIAFRLLSGIYKSGIIGLENHVSLNIIIILIYSLKYLGSIGILVYFSNRIDHFFEYQLIIGAIELITFGSWFYYQLPKTDSRINFVSFHPKSIVKIGRFSLLIAYTSIVWLITSQFDKLILSGILSLKEYGYFSLVIIASSTVLALTGPISQAILPRLTNLYTRNLQEEMIELYRNATQIVALIAISVSGIMAFFSKELIFAWSNNLEAAIWSENIFFWFVLGNGILAVQAFQYYLQVAFGNLKYHSRGATISLIIDLPLIAFFASTHGAIGASISWFVLRFLWLMLWTPFIHRKFLPGFHTKWIIHDVFKIIIPVLLMIYGLFLIKPSFNTNITRSAIIVNLILKGIVVLGFGSLFSDFVRGTIRNHFRQ